MIPQRRLIIKGALALGYLGVVSGAGLLSPRAAFAAWPQGAFAAKTLDNALAALDLSGTTINGDAITLRAPEIAENGAVVPVTVSTDLTDAKSISIFVEKNASPLVLHYPLTGNSVGYVATRIKMRESSNVIAIVKANGKLYRAAQEIRITVGGCG